MDIDGESHQTGSYLWCRLIDWRAIEGRVMFGSNYEFWLTTIPSWNYYWWALYLVEDLNENIANWKMIEDFIWLIENEFKIGLKLSLVWLRSTNFGSMFKDPNWILTGGAWWLQLVVSMTKISRDLTVFDSDSIGNGWWCFVVMLQLGVIT